MRLSLILAVAVSVTNWLAGCSNGTCNCPSGVGQIILPDNLPATVIQATGDSCNVSVMDNHLLVTPLSSDSCIVRISLQNGQTLYSQVQFRSLGGCCVTTRAVADSSAFEYSDGGTLSQ
jgi:hypothetical protein